MRAISAHVHDGSFGGGVVSVKLSGWASADDARRSAGLWSMSPQGGKTGEAPAALPSASTIDAHTACSESRVG